MIDFRLRKYGATEICLGARQVKKVKNPLWDVNTGNLDGFVTSFQQDQYQVDFGSIPVTFESEYVHGKYACVS